MQDKEPTCNNCRFSVPCDEKRGTVHCRWLPPIAKYISFERDYMELENIYPEVYGYLTCGQHEPRRKG